MKEKILQSFEFSEKGNDEMIEFANYLLSPERRNSSYLEAAVEQRSGMKMTLLAPYDGTKAA
jgi:hypothetical protein